MSKRLIALIAALLLGASIGSGGASGGTAATKITVFAAASLTDVFPAIAPGNAYSFSGSNAIAAQITNGAPADVFASANTTLPAQLYAAGLVEKAVVARSPNQAAAQAFIKSVLSNTGQATLARYGFLALPKPVQATTAGI